MAKKTTAKGFGARYGKRNRVRYGAIENLQRQKQICPFCKGVAKRKSKGIWQCKKCGKTFASGTFIVE